MEAITFYTLQPTDREIINQIAEWYFSEWNIPRERTILRLASHPNDDILFQLVLKSGNDFIATGGLYNNVGLLSDQPRFKMYGPWVALLYTDILYRNMGIGAKLLAAIEEHALNIGCKKLYLYSYTAESLYKRNGWVQTERTPYRGHDTVIMEKDITKGQAE